MKIKIIIKIKNRTTEIERQKAKDTDDNQKFILHEKKTEKTMKERNKNVV